MTDSVASIAKEAFDGVAAELSGVIKSVTMRRKVSTQDSYDVESGITQPTDVQNKCRAVFARSDAGSKYFPELVIAAPDELVFIEGAQLLPPKVEDVLCVTGEGEWRVSAPPRDIVQGGGLWATVVRPLY